MLSLSDGGDPRGGSSRGGMTPLIRDYLVINVDDGEFNSGSNMRSTDTVALQKDEVLAQLKAIGSATCALLQKKNADKR